MKEHKSKLERQMAKENENSKRDIVCEVKRAEDRVDGRDC